MIKILKIVEIVVYVGMMCGSMAYYFILPQKPTFLLISAGVFFLLFFFHLICLSRSNAGGTV